MVSPREHIDGLYFLCLAAVFFSVIQVAGQSRWLQETQTTRFDYFLQIHAAASSANEQYIIAV